MEDKRVHPGLLAGADTEGCLSGWGVRLSLISSGVLLMAGGSSDLGGLQGHLPVDHLVV